MPSIDRQIDDAFEDGTLQIWAGGNTGHGIPFFCTVQAPSSAGVFTVGTFGRLAGETPAQIRAADISEASPRGGVNWSYGRWRTIIDVAGYGNYEQMFNVESAGRYSFASIGGATSQATATVTGLATDFVDWFRATRGYLPSPGELHAALLLMGDRQDQNGNKLASQYDNVWGAGRLKMRRFDAAGMDSPYGWAIGQVCVGHGETVDLPMFDNAPFPASIDVVKAVAYWFDRRVDDQPPTVDVPDDINLSVQYSNGFHWINLQSSTNVYEDKERVFAVPVASRAHHVRLTGNNVTADSAGCGQNSMKVYYAYFYEDSARDDQDGPGPEIEPE